MSQSNHNFIDIAIKLGYLQRCELDSAWEQYQSLHSDSLMQFRQFLVQHGYLSPQQLAAILQYAHAENRCTTGIATQLPPEKIECGRVWHGFEILEELGRGGMGIVFKAMQKSPRRQVAIKILLAQSISSKHRNRFLKEMQLSAKLKHPHIVQVYAAKIEENVPYVVMEYIEGKPLHQYICDAKPPIKELLSLIGKVAQALHYTHCQNIIHRDVKPGNILVTKDGTPYLMDFGLARSTRIEDRSLTRTGEVLGTPQYMAPEQVRERPKNLDARADIYALGAVLYTITTGVPPVQGENAMAMVFHLVNDRPIPPRAINDKIPESLQAIILKAMSYNKRNRYNNSLELSDDIERFLQNQPVRAKMRSEWQWKFFYTLNLTRRMSHWLIVCIFIVVSLGMWMWSQRPLRQNLQAAQKAFAHRQYAKAFALLDKIGHQSSSPSLAKIRENFMAQLRQQARWHLQRNQYERALQCLEWIKPVSKRLLKQKLKILQHLQQYAEIQRVLKQFATLDLRPTDFLFMSETALKSGYFVTAARYAHKVLANLPAEEPLLAQAEKYLAQISLYQGDINAAFQRYHRLQEHYNLEQDPHVVIGLAMLYYRRESREQACQYLQQLDGLQVPPNVLARKFFLQARILWNQQNSVLRNHKWLVNQRNLSHFPALQAAMQKIRRYLRHAQQQLEKCPSDALTTALAHEIALCCQARKLEIATTADSLQKLASFRSHLRKFPLAPQSQIFFSEVLVRFLLRNKEDEAAYRESTRTINKFPWTKHMYLLRMIARFSLKDMIGIVDDTTKTIQLQCYDYHTLDNMNKLFLQRFTQQEFIMYYKVLFRFMFGASLQFTQSIFDSYLREVIHRNFDMVIKENDQFIPAKTLHNLLDMALHNVANQETILTLANHYATLRPKIQKLYAQCKNSRQKYVLAKILREMATRKFQDQLRKLRQILLRYSMFSEERYANQVARMGNKEDLLHAIITNDRELPIMRLLAARIWLAMRTPEAIAHLQKLRKSKAYPANVFATVAFRETGVILPLPNTNLPQEKFLRLLFALHLHPQIDRTLYRNFSHELLRSTDPQTALCAAYNFRRFYDIAPLTMQQIDKCLSNLCQNQTPVIRALAIKLLWCTDDLVLDFPNIGRDNHIHDVICPQYCRDKERIRLFLEALRTQSSKEMQLAALQSIVTDKHLRKYIGSPGARNSDFVTAIMSRMETLYDNAPSHDTKFWCALVLAMIDVRGKPWEIICNSNVPIILRSAAIIGAMAKSAAGFDVLKVVDYTQKLSDETGDSELKQVLLPTIPWVKDLMLNQGKLFTRKEKQLISSLAGTLQDHSLDLLNAEHEGIERAAITTQHWSKNPKAISKIYPYLYHEKPHTRRAAATSLASLVTRYRPQQLPLLQKKIAAMDDLNVRKAAAWGYYDYVSENVVFNRHMLVYCDSDQEYEIYQKHLKIEITQQKTAVLNKWLSVLRYANQLAPDNKYYYESALIYRHLQQYTQAQQQLQQAMQIVRQQSKSNSPSNFATDMQAAQIAQKRFGMDECAKIPYALVRCLVLQAEICLERKQNSQAHAYLQQAIAQAPFYYYAYFVRGKLFMATGQVEKARNNFYQAYLCRTFEPELLFPITDSLLEECAIDKILALTKYSARNYSSRHTRKILPKASILYKKGVTLVQSKQYRQALKCLQKALRKSPYGYDIQLYLGIVYYALRDLQQALRHYCYSYLCTPVMSRNRARQILLPIATICCQQGNTEQAVHALQFLHRVVGLTRSAIVTNPNFRRLRGHKWVLSLPTSQ